MKDETRRWLSYSDENIRSARILLDSGLFNPCLQNVQQAVEKALKAIVVEFSLTFAKTHNIHELKKILAKHGHNFEITEDECDFIDAIYLPSKYPIGSALPDFEPDKTLCRKCIAIAERVIESARKQLK